MATDPREAPPPGPRVVTFGFDLLERVDQALGVGLIDASTVGHQPPVLQPRLASPWPTRTADGMRS